MPTKETENYILTTLAADIKEMKGDIRQLKDERILNMDKEITRLTVKTGRLEYFVYGALALILGGGVTIILKWPT